MRLNGPSIKSIVKEQGGYGSSEKRGQAVHRRVEGRRLHGKRKLAIGYHPDADGMAATAILIRHILRHGLSVDTMDLYPVENITRTFEPEHAGCILSGDYDALFCVDFAPTLHEQLTSLRHKIPCLLSIDHHRYQPETARSTASRLSDNSLAVVTVIGLV